MDLFFILLIPVFIGFIGLVFGRGLITWKEFLAQELLLMCFIGIAFGFAASSRTADVELWNGRIAEKEKNIEQCSESYPCNCSMECDSEGYCSEECDTCWEHWDVTTWEAWTSNRELAYSAGGCYNDLPNPPARYLEILVGEPTTKEHTFVNYIKGNPDTVLTRVVSDKIFNIPEYPSVFDHYRVNRFLGVGVPVDPELDKRLDEINADLGARKKVNIIVIVTREADQLYFEKLKEVWIGGKKNDFVVVIGTPEYPKISWANVMSWSDSEDAKVFVKNRILELVEFDGQKILDIIREEVEEKFVKKSMDEFEYLKYRIEPSHRAKVIITILGALASIALTVLAIKEDYFN